MGNVKDDIILWCDVETTGLDPRKHMLLQVCIVPTDMNGVRLTDEVFAGKLVVSSKREAMKIRHLADSTVQRMHQKSGVWTGLEAYDRGLAIEQGFTYEELDVALFNSLDRALPCLGLNVGKVYFGGNSITLDRNFMAKYLPLTYSLFGYQSIDCTTLRRSCEVLDIEWIPKKKYEHNAGSDIQESIDEYLWFLGHVTAR
jgi:oligoribonuclease